MSLSNDDLKAIESMLEPIKRDIRSIQLTLENETNRNIKIIAEGHLDLSRKLDDALKVDNEKVAPFRKCKKITLNLVQKHIDI